MTTTPATSNPVQAPNAPLEPDALAQRNRAVWSVGDFDRIAAGYRDGAARFVERLGLARAERVLDVACGTGNLTLPAARAGARVQGVDIAPQLVDSARRRAAAEGLEVTFEVGNAETLTASDSSFRTVISMFGAMFAPRPERAAAELLRVVEPGGRIALANWTPGSFVGDMLRAHTARVPPPGGVPSPLAWGDDTTVRERFAAARSVSLTRRTLRFHYPLPPEGVARLFCEAYGPTLRTLEALDPAGRAGLFDDLVALWTGANRASDGSTEVDSEYLEVVVER